MNVGIHSANRGTKLDLDRGSDGYPDILSIGEGCSSIVQYLIFFLSISIAYLEKKFLKNKINFLKENSSDHFPSSVDTKCI